jgi:hypothetical protein
MAHQRFEAALRSPEPGHALRSLALEFFREGLGKNEIFALFEQFLLDLRGTGNYHTAEEDAVLDVMDALTGWCHPSGELLPDQKKT